MSDLLLGMGIEPIISIQSIEDRIAGHMEDWGDSDNIVSPEMAQEMSVEPSPAADNG